MIKVNFTCFFLLLQIWLLGNFNFLMQLAYFYQTALLQVIWVLTPSLMYSYYSPRCSRSLSHTAIMFLFSEHVKLLLALGFLHLLFPLPTTFFLSSLHPLGFNSHERASLTMLSKQHLPTPPTSIMLQHYYYYFLWSTSQRIQYLIDLNILLCSVQNIMSKGQTLFCLLLCLQHL